MKYNFWDQHVQRDQQQSSTNSKTTHLAWDSIRSVWWLVTPITETMKQRPFNWEGLKVSFAGLWQWKEVKPVYKDDWCPTIIFQWRKAIAHDSYAMTKHFCMISIHPQPKTSCPIHIRWDSIIHRRRCDALQTCILHPNWQLNTPWSMRMVAQFAKCADIRTPVIQCQSTKITMTCITKK